MIELTLVVLALLFTWRVNRRFTAQEQRLVALEATLARLVAGPDEAASPARAGVAPPAAPTAKPEPAVATPPDAGLRPPTASPPEPPPASRPAASRPVAPDREPTDRGPATARPSRGLEEALGTRWAVWVGGLALGLGGLFLVRYSIEQGLVGPGTRVTLGLVFALALIAGGEWLRRSGTPRPALAVADVPAILTAAGTSTAFATVYAAYELYGLIGPLATFLALGAISLVTMAAATLHGPALAGLGLVASLAAPILVEAQDPNPIGLILYLVFATGAAYGVARLRLWRPLAIAASVGALLWGLAIAATPGWTVPAMVHTLLQLVLAILFLVVDPHRGELDEEAETDRFAVAVLAGFAALAAGLAGEPGTASLRAPFLFAIASLLVGSAYRTPAAAGGAAAAALATVGALLLWPVLGEAGREPVRIVPDLPSAPRPEALGAYLAAAFGLNALVAGPSLWRIVVGARLPPGAAGWLAGAATLGPLASLVAAYWRVADFDPSLPFALTAAALAAGYAASAAWLARRRLALESPALRLAVGATATAAFAALAAGLTFALDRGVLTITLALAALGAAYVADRTAVPALRWVVGAFAVAVAARLAWDPSVMRGEIGTTPIVNWLLWGYGVPAAAFLLAARLLARSRRDAVQRLVESLGIVFAALLVYLETRHALHRGDPFDPGSDFVEAGLAVTEALGFTLLLTRLDLRRPIAVYRIASLVFGALSLAGAAIWLVVLSNPFFTGDRIEGGALFNTLLPAYGLPAAMAAAVAAAARGRRPGWFVLTAAGVALILEITYACLEVRRLFQGPDIFFFRSTSEAELWCYSLVLILNGCALLGAGILLGSRPARLASMACIALAVLKVFIIDLSTLEGLTRALSFVGLGLALVGIGLVYQRLLGRSPPGPPAPARDGPAGDGPGPSLPAPGPDPISPP